MFHSTAASSACYAARRTGDVIDAVVKMEQLSALHASSQFAQNAATILPQKSRACHLRL